MQDLENMPMSMPVTVGELAEFLTHCSTSEAVTSEASTEPQRWAQPRGESADGIPSEADDVLDWSLAQWRAYHRSITCDKDKDEDKKPSEEDEKRDEKQMVSQLSVEEQTGLVGPVLVHRVQHAPPRPILCTDDPEASLLKVVELLLAYPELDAVPVVSPVRCTVVAHLTFAYCLAFMLGRLRGNMTALRDMVISAKGQGPVAQCVFDGSHAEKDGEIVRWAKKRGEGEEQKLWVLRKSQPLRDLLAFFASTSFSGVPIVEDGADNSRGGGLVGFLTRRDLLHYLDLSMQCAKRRASREGTSEEDQEVECAEDRAAVFDASAPVEVVLDTVKRFRQAPSAAQAEEARPNNLGNGAVLVYAEELPLRSLIMQVLSSESRKLLFVEAAGDAAPSIRRIVSVGDTWRFLIGEGSVSAVAQSGTDSSAAGGSDEAS
jgi:hypothetical protein